MSEIDAIIIQIQHLAHDTRPGFPPEDKVLQVLLRLAWEVKTLKQHTHGVMQNSPHTFAPEESS